MKLIKLGTLVTTLSLIFTNSAIAGNVGISVIHAPINPAAVPTLGGMMLIVLCLFLVAISFRMAKNKQGGSFFMTMLVASAIISATGGVKLLSDAHAAAYIANMNIAGGTIDFDYDPNGQGTVNNPANGVPQEIINILQRDQFCSTTAGTTCTPSLVVQPGSSCLVNYSCIGGQM